MDYLPYRHWSVGGVRDLPHGSYTRHNFLTQRGLRFRNFIFSPNYNQVASPIYWVRVYFYYFFYFSIVPSRSAVATGISMISRFILLSEPQTIRVDCLRQNPWRQFRTLWWWRHELTRCQRTDRAILSHRPQVSRNLFLWDEKQETLWAAQSLNMKIADFGYSGKNLSSMRHY